jgi:hypothetical protein
MDVLYFLLNGQVIRKTRRPRQLKVFAGMPENREKGSFTGKMKIKTVFLFFSYLSELFSTFLKSLLHFSKIWIICISKNQSETLPALFQNFVANFLRKCYLYPKSMLLVSYFV